jgi:hypothetical protein
MAIKVDESYVTIDLHPRKLNTPIKILYFDIQIFNLKIFNCIIIRFNFASLQSEVIMFSEALQF